MDEYSGFIYEWTNKFNKKKYVGAHTGKIDDGYTGGGSEFRRDLKKYGLINFERKILEYVADEQTIKDRENYYLDLIGVDKNILGRIFIPEYDKQIHTRNIENYAQKINSLIVFLYRFCLLCFILKYLHIPYKGSIFCLK